MVRRSGKGALSRPRPEPPPLQPVVHVFVCGDCRTLQIAEVPSDLGQFYPSDYYPIPDSRITPLMASAEGERFKLEIVQRFVRTGRLLEIGPAVGGFALLASDAGFDVDTVEMDARCCEFLRNTITLSATQATDAAAFLVDSGPFDVIALWHVLEHLPDPSETLRAAAQGLSEGGILVIAVPNPNPFSSLCSAPSGPIWTLRVISS